MLIVRNALPCVESTGPVTVRDAIPVYLAVGGESIQRDAFPVFVVAAPGDAAVVRDALPITLAAEGTVITQPRDAIPVYIVTP